MLKFRIRAQPGNIRPLYKIKLVCTSLDGTKEYFKRATSKSTCTTSTRVWCNVLTKKYFDGDRTLQEEDAMLFRLNITYSPEPEVERNPSLETVFRRIIEDQVEDDLQFVTYRTRRSNGRLSRPENRYTSLDVLKLHDVDIAKCQ